MLKVMKNQYITMVYNILNKKYQFIGCNEIPRFEDNYDLSNSFFGAIKGSRILKRLLSKEWLDTINFDAMFVDSQTGPGYLRAAIYKNDNY